MDRTGPPLGAFHVEAYTVPCAQGWLGIGQVHQRQHGGGTAVRASFTEGPQRGERELLERAYDRAHAEAMRLLMREFLSL